MAEDPTYGYELFARSAGKNVAGESAFINAEPFLVCHFSNLRPLSVEENRRKNGLYGKAELAMFKRLIAPF
jgi:hypothetical protein